MLFQNWGFIFFSISILWNCILALFSLKSIIQLFTYIISDILIIIQIAYVLIIICLLHLDLFYLLLLAVFHVCSNLLQHFMFFKLNISFFLFQFLQCFSYFVLFQLFHFIFNILNFNFHLLILRLFFIHYFNLCNFFKFKLCDVFYYLFQLILILSLKIFLLLFDCLPYFLYFLLNLIF